MKNELKISILSIVCALCAVVAMPVHGASSVRSLGGAGTYSGTSSAAAAKADSTGSASNSVRGGSMRVNGASSASTDRVSSSRASAMPRLSIGKYLGGSTAVNGGSSIRPGGAAGGQGNSDVSGNLQERIKVLESYMGYKPTGDNIPEQMREIRLDVEKLAADLEELTGVVTDVVYENGELTVTQDGKDTVFDLAKDFAGKSEIEALQDAIDAIAAPDLSEYAKLADLKDAVDALEAADESMGSAISVLQGGMITKDVLDSKVGELMAADKALQDTIDALENSLPSTEGLVNKDYVDNAVVGLQTADQALQDAIAAIVQPDVDKAYVDAAIARLNSAITGLQEADSAMEEMVADLQSELDGMATKGELSAAKAELQAAIDKINKGDVDLTGYYTKVDADSIFAKKSEIPTKVSAFDNDSGYLTEGALTNYVKSSQIQALQDDLDASKLAIAENASDISSLETSVASAASDAVDAKLAAADAVSDAAAAQSTADAAKTAAASAQNLANLNAETLEGLADVAKTGMYGDLIDAPNMEQFVTNEMLQEKKYLTEEKAEQTYLTESNVNEYIEIPDNSITAAKIQAGAVTSEKINSGTGNAGEMVMLMSNGDGTSSWVSVGVAE